MDSTIMISSYKERDLPGLLYLENLRIKKKNDLNPISVTKRYVSPALQSTLWQTPWPPHRLSPLSVGCQRGKGETGQGGQDIYTSTAPNPLL